MSEETLMAIAAAVDQGTRPAHVAELERERDTARAEATVAQAAVEYWQRRNHEAWVFVGELSYILQFKIAAAPGLRDARAGAAKALRMINERVKGGRP